MRAALYEELALDRAARRASLKAEQTRRELLRLRADHASIQMSFALLKLGYVLRRKYRPDQPRVPAGNPDGGQWINDGSNRKPSTGPGDGRIRVASDITGFTKHGIDRAINRGVSPSAIHDAVANPLKLRPRSNGTTQYTGRDATVVLNPNGEVVTVWPR